MNDVASLKKVCISLFFVAYVLLMRYWWLFWSNIKGNGGTLTLSWRRISCFWIIYKSTGRILLIIITIKR